MVVGRAIKFCKNCIFPQFCLGCGVEEMIVCTKCLDNINFLGAFFCPVCHQENGSGRCCQNCLGTSHLSRHIALTQYVEEALIGELMHNFKYNFVESVADAFEIKIKEFFNQNNLFQDFDYIIPVPLHKKRYVERGFNQAEIIAKKLNLILQIPVLDGLIRGRYTCQQAKLDRQERLKNITDAFFVKTSYKLKHAKIIIVDDVYTTGSTIQECAKVLLENGAKEVVGFTIARG